MNTNKKILLSLFLASIYYTGFSQVQENKFDNVDTYVKSLGSLDTSNMGTIANLLTHKFIDKTQKARAIYFWITNNINFEINQNKGIDPKYNSSDIVLKNRKAGSLGYATLFQDMCSIANVRCLTVDGFFKRITENINEKDAEINHYWAVVQLGESPDEWHYVDPACGSGFLDKKGKIFTKSFFDSYFFANKEVFNYQHYPNNTHWQLGGGPRNKKNFYALPIIKSGMFHFGIDNFYPKDGQIKTKIEKVINFDFVALNSNVNKISLIIKENKKQRLKEITDFTAFMNTIKFDYKIEEEGTFNITVLINDKEILQYLIEVE